MKILLDECVPVQLRDALEGHQVVSATDAPFRGLSNGELLALAEAQGFEVLLVADRNMRHQQNLSVRRFAIVELWTNHRPTLERHFDRIRGAVDGVSGGSYLVLKQE